MIQITGKTFVNVYTFHSCQICFLAGNYFSRILPLSFFWSRPTKNRGCCWVQFTFLLITIVITQASIHMLHYCPHEASLNYNPLSSDVSDNYTNAITSPPPSAHHSHSNWWRLILLRAVAQCSLSAIILLSKQVLFPPFRLGKWTLTMFM